MIEWLRRIRDFFQSFQIEGEIVDIQDEYYVLKIEERLFYHLPINEAGPNLKLGETLQAGFKWTEKPKRNPLVDLMRIVGSWFFISLFFMLMYSWWQQIGHTP